MEDWKLRLRESREQKGLTKTAFAAAVGVSNATATDWEKSVDAGGIREISGPKLTKVCEVLGVDPHWLLHGRNSGTHSSNVYHLVPDAMPVREDFGDDAERTHIRKVRITVQAGITGFQVDPEFYEGETQVVPTSWLHKEGLYRDALFALVVKGESMETSLFEGDIIVVNTADTRLVDGNVYVFNYEGEVVVKRASRDAGQWWLTSDNPDQRKYHRKLCRGAACMVIGKVVRKESTHI